MQCLVSPSLLNIRDSAFSQFFILL